MGVDASKSQKHTRTEFLALVGAINAPGHISATRMVLTGYFIAQRQQVRRRSCCGNGQDECGRGVGVNGRPPGRPFSKGRYYGQVAATIFTASTFSFGAFAAEADGAWVAPADDSTVPEISTLWPT